MIEDIEIVSDENTKSNSLTYLKSFGHEEILERRMQWASFITARILCQNVEAREEVAMLLNLQNTNAVSIEQLIVRSEHTPRFNALFIEEASSLVRNYIDGTAEPSHNQLIPPSSRQANLVRFDDYINFLTVDNCIELFFPNGISGSETESYYSTAHPLTLAGSNYGYKHSCADIGFGTTNWGSTEVVNDRSFVKRGQEVIVARPYRAESPFRCLYNEYEHINFTRFLNE